MKRLLCLLGAFILLCGCGTKYPTHEEMRSWSFDKWLAFETGKDGFITLDKPVDELSDRELSDLRRMYDEEMTGKVLRAPMSAYDKLLKAQIFSDYADTFGGCFINEGGYSRLTVCIVNDDPEIKTAIARVLQTRYGVDYKSVDMSLKGLMELQKSFLDEWRKDGYYNEKYGVELYSCGIDQKNNAVSVEVDDPDKIDPSDFDPHITFHKGSRVYMQ